jgi:hypothetical protein
MRCGPRTQVYFDGVPVDGAYAMNLADMYGVSMGDMHIASSVIRSQLNTRRICALIGCPQGMTIGERRQFVDQLDGVYNRSNATQREAAGYIFVNGQGDYELSELVWGQANSGVDFSSLKVPSGTVIQFHTHPDLAPGLPGFPGPSVWDLRNMDPALGQLIWQRDWVTFRSPGQETRRSYRCVPRFIGATPTSVCPTYGG